MRSFNKSAGKRPKHEQRDHHVGTQRSKPKSTGQKSVREGVMRRDLDKAQHFGRLGTNLRAQLTVGVLKTQAGGSSVDFSSSEATRAG